MLNDLYSSGKIQAFSKSFFFLIVWQIGLFDIQFKIFHLYAQIRCLYFQSVIFEKIWGWSYFKWVKSSGIFDNIHSSKMVYIAMGSWAFWPYLMSSLSNHCSYYREPPSSCSQNIYKDWVAGALIAETIFQPFSQEQWVMIFWIPLPSICFT